MKKFGTILLLLTISFFAFTSFKVSRPSIKKRTIMIPKGDDYASQWKEIVAFDQKRLPKSALEVVNNILQKAQQTNNGEQIIKALFYKARYEQSLKENSFNQTLTLFKEEAEKANPTNRSIIYSIIAEQYWSYYQNNRWQIQKRTHTDGVDETDIKTWDIRKIIEATTKYYLLSLENVDNLSRTPINAYTEIITQGKDFDQNTTEKIRPFLYDFLSHRAIDFFINEEPNITQAKETFRVDDEDYFALGKTFVNKNIVIKDSSNLKNYGIILLQKLIKTHLYDEDKTALISVELKRLYFVKNNSVLPNNDELYYNALTTFLETYKSSPSSTEIIYKIALVHFNNSKKYNLKQGLKYKDENKKVLELCRQAFAISENNFGSQQCKTLIDKVKEKTLSIKTEAYVSSAKVRKALISYKNIDKVYFKLIKVDFDKYSTWLANRTADNKHKFIHEKLLSISPEKTWSTSLKDDKDFNSRSTEILIEALQKGHYVLLTSNNEKFEYTNATFQYSSIMVTNISYVSRKINNSTKEFFVTDRETGKPLSDVSAKLFIRYYDYKTRKYKTINKGTFKTNTKGMFKVEYPDIKINKHGSSFYIVFTHKDDILNTSSYSLYPHHKQTTPAKTTTFFYTDRAIYRPGQTVYFKGIVIEKQGDKSTLKTDYKTTVEFVDVNWQKIKSLELTTNEYGSFSGSFVTPDDRLNGMMTIKNSNGSIRISVEEYKRPQFEVEIKPITGTYKLDENVSIKGFAKTYSGAALDGADVTYRVIRNANFPYWVWYRWGYMPTSPEVEIINGTSKTNDKGEFEINFLAQSDKTVSNKFSPTFTYTVYVDIIDVNGETHSANSFVRVSEKALLLSTNIKQKLLIKDFEEIKINSTNLNGEFESTKVKVAIWALQEPKNYFIKRKWQAPEYQTLSKEEFKKNFPYENYADEHLVQNWKKESKVLDKIIFTTKDKNTIKINKENFSQGNYFL
ncbi:MAG: hypothetical protein HF967_04155, partial [Methanosarcinales archaeon]|nr:hypothetical protein [Methanosarcinales archaeon]